MNNSEVRGRRIEVRGQKLEDGSQKIGIGLSPFRPSTFRRTLSERSRCGMTLVEVLLGAAILGIMAVVVVNALFYPHLLAVSNILKQQAVHAGTDEMERVFSQSYGNVSSRITNPGDRYSVNGFKITNVVTSVTVLGSGSATYKRIAILVNYPGGGNPVILETFRYNVY